MPRPTDPIPSPTSPSPASEVPRRPSRAREIALGVGGVAAVGLLLVLMRGSRSAESLWAEARSAFEARDFPRAERALGQLGRVRAPTPSDWMLRAQVAIGLGRDQEAIDDLRQVPNNYAMAATARLEEGQLERARNRFEAAETALQAAIRLDPKQIQARRELIYIYGIELRRDDLDRMFRELSELTQLEGSEVFLWTLSKGLTWDAEENSRTLRKVVDAEPNNRQARLSLGDALYSLNRFDEAEATISSLPEDDAPARALRAQVALARGDVTRAEALLAAGPEDDLGLALLRGKQALAQGDAGEALRHYQVAYRLAPLVREAVFGMGQALRLNRDPRAAALQDQSRRLDVLQGLISKMATLANRDDQALIRELGDACAGVGRFAEARAWYRLLVVLDPLDTQAQAAINRLRAAESAAPAPGLTPLSSPPAASPPETRP